MKTAAATYSSFSTYLEERNDEFRFNAATGSLRSEPATLFSLASNGDHRFRVAKLSRGPESRRRARHRRALPKYLRHHWRVVTDDRRRQHHCLDHVVRGDAGARIRHHDPACDGYWR